MVIHSSFVRNVWISATPRVTFHLFTFSHVWTLLTFKHDESLACLGYPTVTHFSTRFWESSNEYPSNNNFCVLFYLSWITFFILILFAPLAKSVWTVYHKYWPIQFNTSFWKLSLFDVQQVELVCICICFQLLIFPNKLRQDAI